MYGSLSCAIIFQGLARMKVRPAAAASCCDAIADRIFEHWEVSVSLMIVVPGNCQGIVIHGSRQEFGKSIAISPGVLGVDPRQETSWLAFRLGISCNSMFLACISGTFFLH